MYTDTETDIWTHWCTHRYPRPQRHYIYLNSVHYIAFIFNILRCSPRIKTHIFALIHLLDEIHQQYVSHCTWMRNSLFYWNELCSDASSAALTLPGSIYNYVYISVSIFIWFPLNLRHASGLAFISNRYTREKYIFLILIVVESLHSQCAFTSNLFIQLEKCEKWNKSVQSANGSNSISGLSVHIESLLLSHTHSHSHNMHYATT